MRSATTQPPTVRTTGPGARLRDGDGGGGTGDAQGAVEAFGERGHPEVVLEAAQRSGERLGHGSRSPYRPPTLAGEGDGGDGPALQEPQRAVPVERPLHVLGTAEATGGVPGEVGEAPAYATVDNRRERIAFGRGAPGLVG